MRTFTVLGIETSCDETAAAVVRGAPPGPGQILSDVVFSQLEEHRPYGEVVPEIAARAHVEMIDGIVERALADVGLGDGGELCNGVVEPADGGRDLSVAQPKLPGFVEAMGRGQLGRFLNAGEEPLAQFPRRVLSVPLHNRRQRGVVSEARWRLFFLELSLGARLGPGGALGLGMSVALGLDILGFGHACTSSLFQ